MAFPHTFLLDDFNRSDSATLGSNWVAPAFDDFGGGEPRQSVSVQQPAFHALGRVRGG